MVGLGALLMTSIILITQNRRSAEAEQRAQLDLQVNILAEQKVAKLIVLLEELRRDIPTVHDRVDAVAEAMERPMDARAVLTALQGHSRVGAVAMMIVTHPSPIEPARDELAGSRGKLRSSSHACTRAARARSLLSTGRLTANVWHDRCSVGPLGNGHAEHRNCARWAARLGEIGSGIR